MKMTLTAIRVSVLFLIVCGLLYPFLTTGLAQAVFPDQANGSLIYRDGTVVGSKLLSQQVDSPKLFHPRNSAAKYDGAASAGSNQAVASEAYAADMAKRIAALKLENPALTDIPTDLVTTSGSGFDPDLSPEGAKAQIPRISKATGLEESELIRLVDSHTTSRQLGLFGEPRVNVNEINIALLSMTK